MAELRTKALSTGKPSSIDETNRTIRFVASTDCPDADGDIVEQDWDFSRFDLNPQFLLQHNSWCGPIGSVIERQIVSDVDCTRLEVVVQFLKAETEAEAELEAFERAEESWCLAKRGLLRAVSVGFWPGERASELKDGRTVYRLRKNTLVEVSLVTLPANPEAVAKRLNQETDAGSPREAHMDPKEAEELRQKHAEASVALKAAKETEKALRADLDAKSVEVDTLKSELDRERGVRAEAEKQLEGHVQATRVARVKSLVGKKITPAEEATALKVMNQSEELFEEVYGKRADLGLLSQQIQGDAPATKQTRVAPREAAKKWAE